MKNLIFAAIFLVALLDSAYAQKRDNICKKENGVFAHEDYCDYYYECIDGVAYETACPNGLAFSGPGRGLISHCDYAHRVNCPDPETGKIMGQSPLGSGNCPWLFGIFPHPRSCTKYYHCWNGTGNVQKCPFSLLYNEVEHACDWPNKVAGCQQHPLCAGKPNGVAAIQESCVGYWLCLGGYPQLQRCPAGLAFNSNELRCDWAANVPGCEPQPIQDEEELQIPNKRRRVTTSGDDLV